MRRHPRLRGRRLATGVLPLLLLTGTLTAGCGGAEEAGREATGPRVRIVGQNFTEADVLSAIYRALLAQAGFRATIERIGARDLYLGPLEKGTVQVAADTLSATAAALDKADDDASPTGTRSAAAVEAELDDVATQAGITAMTPTRASLATTYAVTRRFAEQHRLRSLSDLGRTHVAVTLGGGQDCADRTDCAQGLQERYGIRVGRVVPLGTGTSDVTSALAAGRVQLAQVSTTDPLLDSPAYVALADDRGLLDPEYVVPLANAAWLEDHPDARTAIESLSAVLTTADLRALSSRVNLQHQSAAHVAEEYLRGKHLLRG